jgi:hypothetical protein
VRVNLCGAGLRCVGLRLALTGAVAAAPLAALILFAAPAGASSIDQYIVADPIPGWPQLSGAQTQSLANQIQTVYSNRGLNIQVGLEAWNDPPRSGVLLIAVLEVPSQFRTESGGPADAVDVMCTSATKTDAPSTSAVPGIDNSAEGICAGPTQNGASPVTTIAFQQDNAVVLIQAAGVGSYVVTGIAQTESAKIPATGIPIPPSHTDLEVAGGVLLVLVVVVALRAYRVRHPEPVLVSPSMAGAYAYPGVAPYGAAGAPVPGSYSQAQAPYGQAQLPHGQTQLPYGQGQAPYGQNQTPYGQSPLPSRPSYVESRPATAHSRTTAIGASGAADQSAAEVPPQAGWYAVGGDQHHLRYWDGTAWTAAKRWNGSDWSDTPIDD